MGGFGVLHVAEARARLPARRRRVQPCGHARATACSRPSERLAGTPLGVWCGRDDPLYPTCAGSLPRSPSRPRVVAYAPGAHTRVYWDSVTLPPLGFVGGVLGRRDRRDLVVVGVPIDSLGKPGGTELAPAALRERGSWRSLGARDGGDLDVGSSGRSATPRAGSSATRPSSRPARASATASRRSSATGPSRSSSAAAARSSRASPPRSGRPTREPAGWPTSTAISTSTTAAPAPRARRPTCRSRSPPVTATRRSSPSGRPCR